ncbi:MAG: Asp-tRNA(Asn)/Glu-tRNA(Gln) amidotransferase subunit GatC [Thermodesulfovibrionales bacterium]|nr:Asp-tRNA(Asn)/Glu-tRNA(Gln) amidotransferase subunit GatC [Thermodesulfovibrionales bacterium]
MKISLEEVSHIAHLARLSLSEEEKERFSLQLSNILTYMEKLNELDTSKIEPTSHVIPLKNVFRDDRVESSLLSEDALRNAPDRVDNFFRVPRIIE